MFFILECLTKKNLLINCKIEMPWYNTYRPQKFDDVIGQELVKKVLQNSILQNRVKNGYLLSGPKGVGKTTIARIFANEINQIDQNPEAKIDILELDAASHTGIDNIRQLIESAQNPPISGKFKIYIIDEVHMLSKAAMSALLKILEEPPQYLIFLLATTNPEKLLPTVLSRLTKLYLKGHTIDDILKKLESVCQFENIKVDKQALTMIAKRSGGSQRDAINMLETVASYEMDSYSTNEVSDFLGLVDEEMFIQTITALTHEIQPEYLTNLNEINIPCENFWSQILEFLLDKSLSGDNQNDYLIRPIAEILSMQLPTSSNLSLFAIIRSQINQTTTKSVQKSVLHEPKNQTETQILEEKPQKFTEQNLPTEKPKLEINSNPPKTDFSENENSPKPTLKLNKNLKTVSVEEITKHLESLQSCPPIFKILIPDLEITEVKSDNTLILSFSNGVFLSQLKSPKMQEFLLDSLETDFGVRFKLDFLQRTTKKKVNNDFPAETFSDENTQGDFINSDESEVEAINNLEKIEKTEAQTVGKEKNKQEIFYKIYQKAPAELTEKIEIIKEISDPKKQKDDDWETHTNMFEFED